jgi:acyl-CoA synthetase (AMP-forming)/AMP-acid ligase II
VATLMWNCSEHLEAYFGVPKSGGVVTPSACGSTRMSSPTS